jgi:plasmid stability protein
MATLIVKNLPDSLYRKLKARAKRERRSVAQEVKMLLTDALDPASQPSVLQLRGLGEEIWRDIDAEAHVAQERAAWRS